MEYAADESRHCRYAREAIGFLTGFSWCKAVKEGFLAVDCGSIIGVFLFRIEPRLLGGDETLWVVVGDLPSAFLVCDDAPDWHRALQRYVREVQQWVDAVRSGNALDEIIPVEASPRKTMPICFQADSSSFRNILSIKSHSEP